MDKAACEIKQAKLKFGPSGKVMLRCWCGHTQEVSRIAEVFKFQREHQCKNPFGPAQELEPA